MTTHCRYLESSRKEVDVLNRIQLKGTTGNVTGFDFLCAVSLDVDCLSYSVTLLEDDQEMISSKIDLNARMSRILCKEICNEIHSLPEVTETEAVMMSVFGGITFSGDYVSSEGRRRVVFGNGGAPRLEELLGSLTSRVEDIWRKIRKMAKE